MNKISLKAVTTSNGGDAFDLATRKLGSCSRTGGAKLEKNLATAGDFDPDGDFVVRIV